MRFQITFIVLCVCSFFSVTIISAQERTFNSRVQYRTGNKDGKNLTVDFVAIYDTHLNDPVYKESARVISEGDFIMYNGKKYYRNDIGNEVFNRVATGLLNIQFDIYQNSSKISTVRRSSVATSSQLVPYGFFWRTLWPGVSMENAKNIYKNGFTVKNVKIYNVEFNMYPLKDLLAQRKRDKEAKEREEERLRVQAENKKIEEARLEKEKLEKERLEEARLEKERLEKERLDDEKINKIYEDAKKVAVEKERAQKEQYRLEKEAIERKFQLEKEERERQQKIEEEAEKLKTNYQLKAQCIQQVVDINVEIARLEGLRATLRKDYEKLGDIRRIYPYNATVEKLDDVIETTATAILYKEFPSKQDIEAEVVLASISGGKDLIAEITSKLNL